MFSEFSDDTALDPISATRLYVETLCQQFPDASANLHRALAFHIGIYFNQTDNEKWIQGARASFEAKVLNAYPQTAPDDYPAWPDISPVQNERSDSESVEAATSSAVERQDDSDDAEVELESEPDSGEATERAPQQRWFYHGDLGELLGHIDDETAVLREAAHRMSALLHNGWDEECARRCRDNWEQSRKKLDALWQKIEEFADSLPASGRLKAPRNAALDEELELFGALFGQHSSVRSLDCENCHGELQNLMRNLKARTIRGYGATLGEWIANWFQADVADVGGLLHDLRALRSELETLCARALEEELSAILDFCPLSKSQEREGQQETRERRNYIFRQRMGWNGQAGRTLQNLAEEWEVSRERIRQIIGHLENWVAKNQFFTPVLSRALCITQNHLPIPAPATDLALLLQSSGITRGLWSLEALADTAHGLGHEAGYLLTPITTDDSEALIVVWDGGNGADNKPLPQRLWHAITTHIWERGIGCWPDLQREIADDEGERTLALAETILSNHPAVRWLDLGHEWFWLDETRALRHQENRLLTPVVRALSVARRLSLARLYAAVTRAHLHNTRSGFDWELPPHEIFERWCQEQSRFTVENGEIEMRDTPPWREVLDNTEAVMIELLEEHGPLLSRYNFYQLALGRGIPKPTFYRYVDGLPTIEEVDDSVFALVGANVMPHQLADFHADYGNVTKRFQLRYGRLDDGQLWISYRIGQGMINNGCLNLPRAMQGEFEGHYELLNTRGSSVANLRFSQIQFWGLKTYFANAVSLGGRVTFIFDRSRHQAKVFAGFSELPHPILSEVEILELSETKEDDE